MADKQTNELLDLVDDTDSTIGTITHEELISLLEEPIGYVRAAAGFIVNSDGQLWIPIRSSENKVAPHSRDFSASAHVRSGETYEEAIRRAFKDQLQIEASASDLKYLGKMGPVSGMPFYHGVFVYVSDETPHYNTQEFSSYEWMDPQDLSKRLRVGVPAKNALLPAVELLIRQRRDGTKPQETG